MVGGPSLEGSCFFFWKKSGAGVGIRCWIVDKTLNGTPGDHYDPVAYS